MLGGGRGIDADEADGDGQTNAPGGGGGGGGATGGEAGGYDDNNNGRGYGGGGGSGTADGGVVNTSGETGSTGFFHDSFNGDLNSNTIVDDISGDPTAAGWQVGMSISAAGIPAGNTIVSIDSATQVTISQSATSSANNRTLTVTGTGGVGGSSDSDYSPSYLSGTPALQNPGTGGSTGADVDGNGGAVVLEW